MNSCRTILAMACLLVSTEGVFANPTGGVVASGSATFGTSGSTLTITGAHGTVINWQNFSIGAGETTRFNLPSNASAILNRVVTGTPSSILGALTSNGNVFLVNPNGVLFGSGSQVSVGGLTVSTTDITDGNFVAGNYVFAPGGGGSVSLAGGIVSTTGSIVINSPTSTSVSGTITSGGTVSVSGPVVSGGGVAIISGSSVSVGGSTASGTLAISGAQRLPDLARNSPVRLVEARVAAAPIALAPRGTLAVAGRSPAGVALRLEKREGAF